MAPKIGAHWLVKSEPSSYGWEDMRRDGTTAWTGVRNHQAAKYLKTMKVGDTAFFYHSVEEKRMVGIVTVTREAYADPTDESGRWVCVDVTFARDIPRPVTLQQVKDDPRLSQLPLVRQSRLSVMPIDDEAWGMLCALGGVAA